MTIECIDTLVTLHTFAQSPSLSFSSGRKQRRRQGQLSSVFSKGPWVPGHKPRPYLKSRYLPIVWEKATRPRTCLLFTQVHFSPSHCLFTHVNQVLASLLILVTKRAFFLLQVVLSSLLPEIRFPEL